MLKIVKIFSMILSVALCLTVVSPDDNAHALTIDESREIAISPNSADHFAITPNGKKVYLSTPLGTITVISPQSNRVITTIDTGGEPRTLEMAPNGKRVYSVDVDTESVDVIDTKSDRIIKEFAIEPGTYTCRLTPNGALLACPQSAALIIGTRWNMRFYSTKNGKLVREFWEVAAVEDVTFSPNGKWAFVISDVETIRPISLKRGKLYDRIGTGHGPIRIKVAPNGKSLYVLNLWSNDVQTVNLTTREVSNIIGLPVGCHPRDMVLDRHGNYLYVACYDKKTIEVIDTKRGELIPSNSVALSDFPMTVGINAKGTEMYVGCYQTFVTMKDLL